MSKFSIKPEPTEHKSILKFNCNLFIVNNETFTFHSQKEAEISPLAALLFSNSFTETVYISQNFIAIKISEHGDWNDLTPKFTQLITHYLNAEKPVLTPEAKGKKIAINVYSEMTPNAGALKFVCNKKLILSPITYIFKDDYSASPLAQALFEFDYVKRVKFENNFIEITKGGAVEWIEVSAELREFIRLYLQSGKAVIASEVAY